MKLSKYYRKEHVGEDCYVLYNTLHMKPIIAKQDEVSKVENMGIHDPAVVEELLHSGIYVLDDSIDSNALIELQSNVESRFGEIKIVYIILTDVCNLRCSYCAVKNIADKNHVIDTYSLSKEKYTKFVKEYVSYAISHNISDPEFIFYGGEPLLNWSALIEIVELINTTANSTITPKYTVVTNGTLLTEDKIIFCKEHKINIGLSVDGPRSITDMTRKAENGMGAYPMIIHAMELLKKHDYIPSLSVTISEDVLRNQATVIDWLQEMHLSFGIKDIAFRANDEINIQWNRKERILGAKLPQIDLGRYFPVDPSSFITLEGGRGCPFSCTFCSTQKFWGNVFVVKPVEMLISEMQHYYSKYGANKFSISHDLFTANRQYILTFCQKVCELPFKVEWGCSSRLDVLDEELIAAMIRSGCTDIYIGIESGSQRMQKKISKNLNIDILCETLSLLLSGYVSCILSFIYGYPCALHSKNS